MVIFILSCIIFLLIIFYWILYKKAQKIYIKHERSEFPKMKRHEVIAYDFYSKIGDGWNIAIECLTIVMPILILFIGVGLLSKASYTSAYKEEKIKVENQYKTCLVLIKNNNNSQVHYPETIKEINKYNTLIETKQSFLQKSLFKDFEFDFYIDMPTITYEILDNGNIIIKGQ